MPPTEPTPVEFNPIFYLSLLQQFKVKHCYLLTSSPNLLVEEGFLTDLPAKFLKALKEIEALEQRAWTYWKDHTDQYNPIYSILLSIGSIRRHLRVKQDVVLRRRSQALKEAAKAQNSKHPENSSSSV